MSMKNVTVKKSHIQGRGVFAAQNFKRDEIVMYWQPKILTPSQAKQLSTKNKHFLEKTKGGKYLLMQPPERYVNHSCDPNTKVKKFSDVAIRDIAKGEKITSYYQKHLALKFKCKCGNSNCLGDIK